MGSSTSRALSGSVARSPTVASDVRAIALPGGGGGGPPPPPAANPKYRNGQPYLFQKIPGPDLPPHLDPTVYIGTEAGTPPIPASYSYVLEERPGAAIPGLGKGSVHPVTPTHIFIDEAAGWWWDVDGGDILDKNLQHNPAQQVPSLPEVAWHSWPLNFSSSSAVSHLYALDILLVTQYCQTNSRWMAFLWKTSVSTRTLAGRFSANPASIAITYQDGTTETLSVRVHAQSSTASAHPQSTQIAASGLNEFTIASTTQHHFVEFDRPQPISAHGPVTVATLSLMVTKHSAAANLLCFLADPKPNVDLVQLGIANDPAVGYYDSGIQSLPSVIGSQLHPDGSVWTNYEHFQAMNPGDEGFYDPALFTYPFVPTSGDPITYASRLPHLGLGKWVGGDFPHTQFQDSLRSFVPSTYTGDGYEALAPGVGAMRVEMEVNPVWQADGVFASSSAPASSTTSIRIFLPAQYWGSDHIFIRHYLRIGSPLGQPYRMNYSDVKQVGAQAATFFNANFAWTRSGTTATIAFPTHPFAVGDFMRIMVTTDPVAMHADPSSSSIHHAITGVPDADHFTIACPNAGGVSGTIQITADPNAGVTPGPGTFVGGVRGMGQVGRYDWSDAAGKTGIMPDHWSASGGTSGVAGGGRGWQLRNAWCDLIHDEGPDIGGYGFGLHTYDFVMNPPGYYNASGSTDSGYGMRGGLGGVLYGDQWYCLEWEIKLNTVYPDTSFIAPWTWAGGVLTVTKANHGLVRPTIAIAASSGIVPDPVGHPTVGLPDIPNNVGGPLPVTVIDANTFSVPVATVNATSGTAAFSDLDSDGVVRMWIDGRMAYEKQNFVMRALPYYFVLAVQDPGTGAAWPTIRHVNNYVNPGRSFVSTNIRPTANLGFKSLWLNWFHGGITPNTVPRVLFFSQLVYGTSYIGPMKEPPADIAPTPQWLTNAGNTVSKWVSIPGTQYDQMTDMQTVVNAGLATVGSFASHLDTYPTETGHSSLGEPRAGPFGDSGGCLRTNGSEMIVAGGGGAGTWSGNDVRGLRLEDNNPVWRVLVRPTGGASYFGEFIPVKNSVGPPARGDPPTPYNKDKDGTITTAHLDGSPVARHTYRHQFVDDATDDFHFTRCDSVWQTDSRPPYPETEEVNSIHLPQQFGAGWNSVAMASTWPNTRPADRIHPKPGGTGSPSNYCCTCKFPTIAGDIRSGFVYQAMGSGLFVYQPNGTTGSLRGKWNLVTTFAADKGAMAIDPTRNILLFGTTDGLRAAPTDPPPTGPGVLPIYKVLVLNPTGDGGTIMPVTFTRGSGFTLPTLEEEIGFNEWTTGDAVSNFARTDSQHTSSQHQDMPELEYDRGLDKFLWFQDDGRMLTLTCISTAPWTFRFDVLVTTGTPPPAYSSHPVTAGTYATSQRQLIAFWGRMRYIHRLRGVALVPNFNQNAYFLRTS